VPPLSSGLPDLPRRAPQRHVASPRAGEQANPSGDGCRHARGLHRNADRRGRPGGRPGLRGRCRTRTIGLRGDDRLRSGRRVRRPAVRRAGGSRHRGGSRDRRPRCVGTGAGDRPRRACRRRRRRARARRRAGSDSGAGRHAALNGAGRHAALNGAGRHAALNGRPGARAASAGGRAFAARRRGRRPRARGHRERRTRAASSAEGAGNPGTRNLGSGFRSVAATSGDRYHVVAAGESLWSISRDALGGSASPAKIAREVNRLWGLNSARIATGDPDLLRVGTKLVLR
jgi:hypothetical protein